MLMPVLIFIVANAKSLKNAMGYCNYDENKINVDHVADFRDEKNSLP